MAIGIVSDSDLQQELSRLNKSVNETTHTQSSDSSSPNVRIEDSPLRGRKEGDVNVPDSLRKIIGEESVINGRASALKLASDFGISPSSVSAYANGATSTTTYDKPNKSLIGHLNKSRARAIKKASHVLNSAMAAITQEKLDYTDASDLSGIAKDMSVIIKNLEPPAATPSSSDSKGPSFIIYAPQFKSEEKYEVIDVKE